jgi:hypothetical protein
MAPADAPARQQTPATDTQTVVNLFFTMHTAVTRQTQLNGLQAPAQFCANFSYVLQHISRAANS